MDIRAGRAAAVPRITYLGEVFRHMAARWDDPMSGEGAGIHGGRFNPPGSFPVLHPCSTRSCGAAEFRHRGDRLVIGVEGLLPRVLYRCDVSLDRVLNLTSRETLDPFGVLVEQIVGTDVAICRQIGEAAHAAGPRAIRSPSATGVDDVLAVFPELLGSGRLLAAPVERWESIGDL